MKKRKYIDEIIKYSSEPLGQFQPKHDPWVKGIQDYSNMEPFNSQEDSGVFSSPNQRYDKMIWFFLF